MSRGIPCSGSSIPTTSTTTSLWRSLGGSRTTGRLTNRLRTTAGSLAVGWSVQCSYIGVVAPCLSSGVRCFPYEPTLPRPALPARCRSSLCQPVYGYSPPQTAPRTPNQAGRANRSLGFLFGFWHIVTWGLSAVAHPQRSATLSRRECPHTFAPVSAMTSADLRSDRSTTDTRRHHR